MKMTFWGLGVAAGLCAAGSSFADARAPLAPHVPGELVVKIEPSHLRSVSALHLVQNVLGKSIGVQTVRTLQTDPSLHKVTLSKVRQLKWALDRLNYHSEVVYAEPNYLYSVQGGLPNDERVGELWGLKNTGQADKMGQLGAANADINVLPLWDQGIRGNRRIVVAVIDTGMDIQHPDLVDNLYTNAQEIAGNGIDDDQNGFVDDRHGWNFVTGTNDPADDHDHGTHCAGTIGGTGNNSRGVVGVNWEVSLMPLKFIAANGNGTLEAAIEAINYATLMRVNVMSNSWGGGGMSVSLRDSIVRARDAGILFVAAAGNAHANNDSAPNYPANYDVENVVAVAASDNRDSLADFSSYGKRTVHVAAPGNWILSTVRNGAYNFLRGTSMAAPHVSGAAALLLSAHPEWSYAEIKDRLIRSSDKVRGLKRWVKAGGRINTYQALMGIFPPLEEPQDQDWQDVSLHIESPHPYAANQDQTHLIEVPGAKFVRVIFDRVDLEPRYDRLWLEDPVTGERVTDLTGRVNQYVSDYIEGSTARLRFASDYSVNNWGFLITRVQAIYQ